MINKMLYLGALGISYILNAQNIGLLHGTIIDSKTSKPIPNVIISLDSMMELTNNNGNFVFKGLNQGTHHIDIQKSGYEPTSYRIDLRSDSKNVIIPINEKVNNIDEIFLSKRDRKSAERESSIISLTVNKEFLEKNRESSLMQTLDKIPGVSSMNIGSGQSKPVIRGMGFNRVAVVQNGIKHEAQQWGSDHGLEIDQYGVESVQIIKGPASLLYGSDAVGGVINLESPSIPLKNTFQGSVNLLAESNNNLIGLSSGFKFRKEKWYYNGRLTYRDYGDYKVPTDKINFDGYTFTLYKNHLRNTAGQEANAAFSVGYTDGHIKSETFFSNVNAKNGFFANAHGLEVRNSQIDYDFSSRDIDLPSHQVNHFKVSNNTTLSFLSHSLNIDAGFQNNYREEYSEPIPHGYMPKPADSRERIFNKNTLTVNVTDVVQVYDRHEIITGFNVEQQNNRIGGWGFLIPAYNRFSAGGFIYDKYAISFDLHLQTGLRYDYGNYKTAAYYDWYPSQVTDSNGNTNELALQRAQDKTLHFKNFSGSVGLSYLVRNTTYKINAGKSFRMPLASELASDGVNYHMYRFERGNMNLAPESSYQLDLEVSRSEKNFSVAISPFLNYFDNYLYLNPTSKYFETLQIYEYTQAKVFRAGGEITTSVKVTKNLDLDASGEYVYSRQKSGPKKDFTLPFSPPLSGLLTVRYNLHKILFFNNTSFSAMYRIAATLNEIVPPENITPGYQVFNISFFSTIKTFKNKTLDIRIKINNVLNTTYFNHTSFYRLIEVPEAGRNLSLSLTQNF